MCKAVNREKARKRRERNREKLQGSYTGFTHGIGGYDNWGCRCEVCKAAAQKNRAKYRAGLKTRPRDEVPHGTANGYNHWACRCDPCRTAAYAARSKYVDAAEYYAKHEALQNERSRAFAHHHRDTWTGPELEILSRETLSLADAAQMLGRTLAACREMRRKLRVDPRKKGYL
ncbi:hypothetical protein SEA_DOUG_48 [Mycobacterium phage Doug]|uniref:Helix-turn-helix DNA binding domain protein n=1 Tax=Mycobacterium phage Doug TaxID=2592659 RepID=A0A5J6T350_9CAUD|nr:HTH DNA binding protein [Mycobacterium phage Doug]QFG04826.1 hypothetical protein SEA_DOUG_48 [Mycobacterium phage Doug]